MFVICLLLFASPARADFVQSNLRFTLFHEVGHAVIDQRQVRLFGPEETAADGFGIYLGHLLLSEGDMAEMISDMTWLARDEADEILFDPWAEYMPGSQRLAWAVCLYYGLAPDDRGPLARALGMPSDSKRACTEAGAMLDAAWRPILAELAPETPNAAPTFRADRSSKALRLLAKDIDAVNQAIQLPRPVPVVAERCGEDNAYYYHIDERIAFCDEMTDALLLRAARR